MDLRVQLLALWGSRPSGAAAFNLLLHLQAPLGFDAVQQQCSHETTAAQKARQAQPNPHTATRVPSKQARCEV